MIEFADHKGAHFRVHDKAVIDADMVERAARAIYDNFAFEPSDKSYAALADTWRKPARAALEAALNVPAEQTSK